MSDYQKLRARKAFEQDARGTCRAIEQMVEGDCLGAALFLADKLQARLKQRVEELEQFRRAQLEIEFGPKVAAPELPLASA